MSPFTRRVPCLTNTCGHRFDRLIRHPWGGARTCWPFTNYQWVAEHGVRDPLVRKELLCLFQVWSLPLSCGGSKAIFPNLGLRPGASRVMDVNRRVTLHHIDFPYPQPQRLDTLVLFSIRKALAAVDQGRTSVECPDFSTNQSHTASHLNSSKPINIDQAAFGLNRHNVALS